MIDKIKQFFTKDRLNGHQPETDPEGPPPKSGGIDTTKAPGSIEPPKEKEISFDTEEIDLEGKPSKVLVLKCEETDQDTLKMLQDQIKHLANEADLSPKNRKQVMLVNGEDVKFQTINFEEADK